MRDITASGDGRMNLEMEGREEQDSELVRAAARRLTLSLVALCKLFRMVAALDALYTLAREFTQRYSSLPRLLFPPTILPTGADASVSTGGKLLILPPGEASSRRDALCPYQSCLSSVIYEK